MKFDSESAKKEFKNLCVGVLPAIENIEHALKKIGAVEGASIRIGGSGYLSLDINGSKWRMARYERDDPIRIIYEHSEEISVSDGRIFDKVSENLVEISLVFASLQSEIRNKQEIDSFTWKQQFVVWANEFEQIYGKFDWGMAETGDKEYLEAIEKFAKNKIRKFAGLEE